MTLIPLHFSQTLNKQLNSEPARIVEAIRKSENHSPNLYPKIVNTTMGQDKNALVGKLSGFVP